MEPFSGAESFPALLLFHVAPTVDHFYTRMSDTEIKGRSVFTRTIPDFNIRLLGNSKVFCTDTVVTRRELTIQELSVDLSAMALHIMHGHSYWDTVGTVGTRYKTSHCIASI